ncbi:MAG: hypothetical protein K7J46_04375 [Bryobacter sp.]|jgi:hypothetical protein|nr:hypothetical protein [Bryobacter sp. CoA8 C33]
MKLLLDECLPVALPHSFPGHEVHSVDWAGFKGMKNGTLLQAAPQSPPLVRQLSCASR